MIGLLIAAGLVAKLVSDDTARRKKARNRRLKEARGSTPDEPGEWRKKYTRGGGSKGAKSIDIDGNSPPSKLAPDAVWVGRSPDGVICTAVVFGDGTGEAFWKNKALPVAKKYISEGWGDPYLIAVQMIRTMAPCAEEFPHLAIQHWDYEERAEVHNRTGEWPPVEGDLDSDGTLTLAEREFGREIFLRAYRDVYYLIQFLHDKIAELMGREDQIIKFDSRCEVTFVGKNWHGRPQSNPNIRNTSGAEVMARFYVEYMYPVSSNYSDHHHRFKAWQLADSDEKYMNWYDNIATAIINRMHPECGIALASAFKKEPFSAESFFATRPGLEAEYYSLVDLIQFVEDLREGGMDISFDNVNYSEGLVFYG